MVAHNTMTTAINTTTTTTTTTTTAAPPVPAASTALTEDSIAQSLAQDRPTIDAAIKTFMIWVVARSLTSSATDEDDSTSWNAQDAQPATVAQASSISNAEALAYARIVLQATNRFQFDESLKSTSKVAAVTAQVWNGLLASQQKPARFLGRIALRHAWDGIVVDALQKAAEQTDTSADDSSNNKATLFIQEFGQLLKEYKPRSSKSDASAIRKEKDSNAALIWDEPGVELERRRERRQLRAEEAIKEEALAAEEKMTPRIEEIIEEEEEEVAAEEESSS
mmetsp:Transcript_24969/g.41431  ORF Transcript_24969/g.41431 Transcript_24969/m.41431 type:complete len:280 (-) Transcript_24969:50-889(-)